jgi:hypothetical protein
VAAEFDRMITRRSRTGARQARAAMSAIEFVALQ